VTVWWLAGQLLPSVFKSNAWGILHTLLEMFSYRLHHIQAHYRVQLLSQLHQLAQVQQMTQYQLHLWYDIFFLGVCRKLKLCLGSVFNPLMPTVASYKASCARPS